MLHWNNRTLVLRRKKAAFQASIPNLQRQCKATWQLPKSKYFQVQLFTQAELSADVNAKLKKEDMSSKDKTLEFMQGKRLFLTLIFFLKKENIAFLKLLLNKNYSYTIKNW